MNILEKLKAVKRKWIYLSVAVIIIVVAGGITGKVVHERFEDRNGGHGIISAYQGYYDLLYLENTNDQKITPEQAKAILPIVEKLSTADTTTQADLLKSIYQQLTPQQYYALLNGGNKTGKENYKGKGFRPEGESDGRWESGNSKDKTNIMSESLKDVVVNMLKSKSSK